MPCYQSLVNACHGQFSSDVLGWYKPRRQNTCCRASHLDRKEKKKNKHAMLLISIAVIGREARKERGTAWREKEGAWYRVVMGYLMISGISELSGRGWDGDEGVGDGDTKYVQSSDRDAKLASWLRSLHQSGELLVRHRSNTNEWLHAAVAAWARCDVLEAGAGARMWRDERR